MGNEQDKDAEGGDLMSADEDQEEDQERRQADQDEAARILEDENRRQQGQLSDGDTGDDTTTDGAGDGTATDGAGDEAPTAKEEIDRVINKGTQEEQQDQLKSLMEEFTENAPEYKGIDKGLALAKIGFAMAAGKSPRAIENISKAMNDGADMLIKDKAKKAQERKQGNKNNKGMMMDDDDDAPSQLPEKWAVLIKNPSIFPGKASLTMQ